MIFGDVNAEVEDFNLGRGSGAGNGVGVQVKIGASNVQSKIPIQITGSMSVAQIREKLGRTPLADACLDAVEWGAADIRCIPVKATVKGTVSDVKAVNTGQGILTVEGDPNNEYSVIVEITDSGQNNEAGYRYSLDHGATYSEESVIPLAGTAVLEDTGLTLKFAENENGDSWIEGDTFCFTTTAPTMNNQDVLDAVEKLFYETTAFEFIHIVGTTSRALWAACGSLADDFLNKYKKPVFFILEQRCIKPDESMDQYITAMEEDAKGINNRYLQVVCSWSKYQRKDGRVQLINNAGIVSGLYCQAKESQSIGETRSFPVSEAKMLALQPAGIEMYLQRLNNAKYLTFRKYVGKEDYYVTNACMMAPDGSDYTYAEDVRVSNRLVKDVRAYALNELQIEVDPDNLENDLTVIEEYINTPIETAVDEDNIISSGRLEINRETDILVSESLDVTITYVPKGHVREINLTFQVENPYTSGE